MKIAYEKRIVERMIRLYCRKHEKNSQFCDDCRQLLLYAHTRLARCKYGDTKPTCRLCSIHCYRLDMRDKIQTVMRFSGPRMLLYHPLDAICYLWFKWTAQRSRKDSTAITGNT